MRKIEKTLKYFSLDGEISIKRFKNLTAVKFKIASLVIHKVLFICLQLHMLKPKHSI